jgi:hypothetical protein
MVANVQQTTIKPIIEATVAKGALIHTDEYGIYARLPTWGYQHKTAGAISTKRLGLSAQNGLPRARRICPR